MRDLTLPDGDAILRYLSALPLRALNLFGLGYPERFALRGRNIVRPERFRSHAHKKAFAFIGAHLVDPLAPDALTVLQFRHLAAPSRGRPELAPEIWEDVLRFFVQEGALERRWELCLPTGNGLRQPFWDADGRHLPLLMELDVHGKALDDGTSFIPTRLTDAQVERLIGKPYATEQRRTDHTPPRSVILAKRDFHVVYVRPAGSFSAEELERYTRPSRA